VSVFLLQLFYFLIAPTLSGYLHKPNPFKISLNKTQIFLSGFRHHTCRVVLIAFIRVISKELVVGVRGGLDKTAGRRWRECENEFQYSKGACVSTEIKYIMA